MVLGGGSFKPFGQELAHPLFCRGCVEPACDFEVGDPQRRRVVVLEWDEVGEHVAKGPLLMSAMLAGKERRLGLAEPTALKTRLLFRLRDPRLYREGDAGSPRV